MRFAYYRQLSAADKATYRASDEYGSVELDDPSALWPIADEIGAALLADDRVLVEKLTQRLVTALSRQLEVPSPGVRVLAERPRSSSAELYGLYVRAEDERPVLMVWMRTAAREKPVAHKTYLRTVFHEVCHHLDYELLELDESFHTQGFFQRESSLMRQLGPRGARTRRASASTDTASASQAEASASAVRQLALPW